MSKTAFYELSQCILSYHDWMKVDGLWDLLPNYQKNLTNLIERLDQRFPG